ncbi:MAG: DUF2892 domain-containing protein [Mariprofundaceae bacterium]
MKANVGTVDRFVRGIVGLALILAGFLAGLASPWNWVAIGVGVVLVLTALISFCPLYRVLGVNTCGGGKEA